MIREMKLLVIILCAFFLFSACSENGGGNNTEASGPTDPAHAEEVKLVGYLIGEAPKGMPEVLDALNAKLKKDINATLELNYIAWSDLASKYPLLLANGENVDFIFSAEWNFYMSEAIKGAFYPLSFDLLDKYMPRHMAKLPLEAIEAAYVNGVPYMIPTSSPDRKVSVALFRRDVMEKAEMKEIKKFSDIEPYLAEIKRDYPGMIPLNLDSQFDLPAPYYFLLNEKMAWPGAPFDSGDPMAQGIVADMEDPSGQMMSMVDEPMLGMQKYAAQIMKGWYDAGYMNRNPFANDVRSKDNFCNGKSGVAFGNSIDMMPIFSTCKERGIDIYPLPLLYPSGKSTKANWLVNGVSLAANTKHPERALEALDLIMEDPAYAYLVYFGIEGRNYALMDDGKIGLPAGVTSESNTYPPDASGFWFVNKNLFKPMSTWTDDYVALQQKMDDYLEPTPLTGFSFHSDNVKSEVANLKNVSTQYAQPIYIGAVDNVDSAFETLIAKLKSAGIDRVKTEVAKQGAEFLAHKTK